MQVDLRVELWRGGADGAELLQGADRVIAVRGTQRHGKLCMHCVQNNIKVFSSMNAGAKSDPTRIQIADLSATLYYPLTCAVLSRSEWSFSVDAPVIRPLLWGC